MAIPVNPTAVGNRTKKSDYDTLYDNAILAETGGTAGGAQTVPGDKTFSGISTLTGGKRVAVKAVASANYTITDTDGYEIVLVTTGASDRTITLPTAADNTGRVLTLINVDDSAGHAIVDGEGAELINSWASLTLVSQHDLLSVVCDGTGWLIVSKRLSYSTGWVANSDWTNQELTVTHNLGFGLSSLLVRFFISTDGTEANARELLNVTWAVNSIVNSSYGHQIYAIGSTSFKIQTGAVGMMGITDAGVMEAINTQSWKYKVLAMVL